MKKSIIVLSAVAFVLASFTVIQNEPWNVPDKYIKMANPVKSDAASLATGKEVWVKHCQSCHGKSGKGDGSKAEQLKTEPGDFTK